MAISNAKATTHSHRARAPRLFFVSLFTHIPTLPHDRAYLLRAQRRGNNRKQSQQDQWRCKSASRLRGFVCCFDEWLHVVNVVILVVVSILFYIYYMT